MIVPADVSEVMDWVSWVFTSIPGGLMVFITAGMVMRMALYFYREVFRSR